MAFATGEFLEVWSRTTTAELRQKSIWLNLLSKTGTEGWVSGAAKAQIPKPTYTNAHAETRARGGAWATADQIGQDTVEFSRTGGVQVANEVLAEDAAEIPWPLIDNLRSRQGYEMSKKIDTDIWTWLTGTSGATTTVNLGTAGTDYIDRDSPYAGSTTKGKKLPFDAIDQFHLKLQRADALDGIGDAVGQRFIVMTPEVFRVLRNYMIDEKFGWDILTADILKSGSVLANADYQGRLLGIDVFSWNGISIPTGSNNWPMIAGARAGAVANVRPAINQFFDPTENQVSTKPAYLSRQTMEFGTAMLLNDVFTEYYIHAD